MTIDRAAGVSRSTASVHEAGPGASPRAALHHLEVKPVTVGIAKALLVRNHYLHSLPGGTKLAFGVFAGDGLKGALTFGVGPKNAHRLVDGVFPEDCVALTRLWLSDDLPRNSESRVLGVAIRALKRDTSLKFIVSYADPSQGHAGTIYQAAGWLYTGLSEAMPMYDVGDGIPRHSRTFSHVMGTHSITHFRRLGLDITKVKQQPKHRYVCLLDPSLSDRLTVRVLPYPKPNTIEGGET